MYARLRELAEQTRKDADGAETRVKIEQKEGKGVQIKSEFWDKRELKEEAGGGDLGKGSTFCEKLPPNNFCVNEQTRKYFEDEERTDEKLSLKIKQEELIVSQKLFFKKQEIDLNQVKTEANAEIKLEPQTEQTRTKQEQKKTTETDAEDPKNEAQPNQKNQPRLKQKIHLKFKELKTMARKNQLKFKKLPQEALAREGNIEDFIESLESENIKRYLDRTIQSGEKR